MAVRIIQDSGPVCEQRGKSRIKKRIGALCGKKRSWTLRVLNQFYFQLIYLGLRMKVDDFQVLVSLFLPAGTFGLHLSDKQASLITTTSPDSSKICLLSFASSSVPSDVPPPTCGQSLKALVTTFHIPCESRLLIKLPVNRL